MTNHKLLIRKFRGEIPKNGGSTPRHIDEVLELEREGNTGCFRISLTQLLIVPNFVANCPKPQWGSILDNSSSEQISFPVLVMERPSDTFNFDRVADRSHAELQLLDDVRKKFPKTFDR
jgi:hypothetical protein